MLHANLMLTSTNSSFPLFPQDCIGSYTLIPYVVTATGRVLCGDAGLLRGLADGLVQAGVGSEALLTPLVGRLARLLEATPTDSW